MEHRLSDIDVVKFIVTGYHIVEPDLPEGLNETIAAKLDGLDSNPGDAITDTVPELNQVLDHPKVTGALASLLGDDYEVQSHRHWHCKQPNLGTVRFQFPPRRHGRARRVRRPIHGRLQHGCFGRPDCWKPLWTVILSKRG